MVQVPLSPPTAIAPDPFVNNGAEDSKVEEGLGAVASSNVNGTSNGTTTAMTATGSPMKAAADLIQTLDIAYSEMTTCAADAAKDAEAARRNARAASEIARRYLHRSYPKVHSSFGALDSTNPSSQKTPSPTGATQDPLLPGRAAEYEGETKEGGSISLTVRPASSNFLTSSPSHHQPTGTYPNLSSTERIAQSHAEDVLALSMELEQTKQALKSEKRMLEEAKSAAANLKTKSTDLESQNEKLLQLIEQLKREKEERTSELEENLRRATLRVQAAEEDAQVALDLAKESAEKRDEMEEQLDDAKEKLRVLKEQLRAADTESPRGMVRFANGIPPPPPPPPPPPAGVILPTPTQATPSRSMVAVGRQLLRRANAASPQEEVIALELTPAKSAERRRKLRDRLIQYDEEEAAMTLFPVVCPQPSVDGVLATSNSTMVPRSPAGGTAVGKGAAVPGSELADFQNAAKLLQESGKRLELSGHWWRNKGASRNKLVHEMEAMTRQYCKSVEFKIGRQKKEIDELDSLCGFLEQKLVTGSGSAME